MQAVDRTLLSTIRVLSFIKNMAIIDRRKLYQVWEQSHLARLLAYLEVDCVFDIGANQGQYAGMLRRNAGFEGFIFSFEPNPHDARIARAQSEGDDKWMVIETAIAEADGTAELNIMHSSEFSSVRAF